MAKRRAASPRPAALAVPYAELGGFTLGQVDRVRQARAVLASHVPKRDAVPELTLVREGGVLVAQDGKDRGTPERWRHGEKFIIEQVYDAELGAATVRRSLDVAPLDHYARRELITQHQWKAGDMLRAVFRLAGIEPRVTANLLGTGGGAVDISDAKASAMHDYRLAMTAVGVVLSPIIVHVVCLERLAVEWAELRGLRGTSAKVAGMTTLRLALDSLVHHYHLT